MKTTECNTNFRGTLIISVLGNTVDMSHNDQPATHSCNRPISQGSARFTFFDRNDNKAARVENCIVVCNIDLMIVSLTKVYTGKKEKLSADKNSKKRF